MASWKCFLVFNILVEQISFCKYLFFLVLTFLCPRSSRWKQDWYRWDSAVLWWPSPWPSQHHRAHHRLEVPGCNPVWILKAGIHGWNDWAGVSAHWGLDGHSVIQGPALGNSQSWCPFWGVWEPSSACLPLGNAAQPWLCEGCVGAGTELLWQAGRDVGQTWGFSALWECRSLYHIFLKMLCILEPGMSVICANATWRNNKWNFCRDADSSKASWILFW